MKENITIGELTQAVSDASTEFEKNNTELKRKYLLWNIEAFNLIASRVSVCKGTFGTGYPFYALGKNLEGTLPIITEQIRYNRQLVKDGVPIQKSIWKCKSCLYENYDKMQDLKSICKPCPNVIDKLKPRKIINRLPDMDMWVVCQDGKVEKAERELTKLFEKNNMHTSDVNPANTIDNVVYISKMLKQGKMPEIYLAIDAHIIEQSVLKKIIEEVPQTLKTARKEGIQPYLPIHPKSYRKNWQYDDEAYNYIFDFLASFTEFNFEKELQQSLDTSRKEVSKQFSIDELLEFLWMSAKESTFRRFQNLDVEENFRKRVNSWNTERAKVDVIEEEK